ncbi:PAS domain-containing protein [Pseudanabaena sp. FACHB-2040]|uniref:hybrid sensor histidine kinase/response regulator n=1 Tax=Pseudanabaena sp. FACHB-2040 TaxID=2692859 RepID=UPI0016871F95|nr:PAS domain-containing protein [Pseudanabaena sp. FACHB-2040]
MQTNTLAHFLNHKGRPGDLLQSYNWAETRLGPLENWPQSLQTALSICLTSPLPMFMGWGEELILFYNEACQQALDLSADTLELGQPVRLGCPRLWAVVGSLLQQVMQGETAQAKQFSWSSGSAQERAFTFASSPILNESGEIGGVFTVVSPQPSFFPQASPAAAYRHHSEKSTEEVTEQALESITDAFVSFDGEWRFTYVNQAAAQLLDHPPAALLGKRIWQDIFELDAGRLSTQQLQQALIDQQPLHLEDYCSSLSRYLEINAYPSEAGIAVYFRDISDRKHTEAELRRQKDELRLITDAIPALIAYVGADQRYQFANRAFTTWFGQPAETVVGQRIEEFVGPQAYPRMRPSVEAALAGNLVMDELWLPFRQGSSRYVRRQYIPDRQANGDIRGFYALVNDITDLKLTQDALLRSEERYRSLVSILASIVWSTDQEGQFTSPQSGWETFTGQSWQQHQGWGWLKALHPDDREPFRLTWVQAHEACQIYSAEGRLWHASSQQYRYFESRGVPLFDETGKVREWVGIITDIDDRRRVENALRLSESYARSRVEELEALMEVVPAAIWIAHDRSGNDVTANLMAYQLTRTRPGLIQPAALVKGGNSLNFRLIRQGEELPSEEWPIQTCCRQGIELENELEMRFDDGSTACLYGKTVPLRDQRGQIRGAIGAYVDITERRHSEEVLRRSNATLGLLSEVANQLLLNEQPKAFIDRLYNRLSEHLGLELYFNYLFDETQQQLYLHAYGGIPSHVADRLHWLKLGQTVSGTVALHRRRLVVEDTQQTTDPITEQIRELGVMAYACYPLLSRGQFIGTLSFGTRTRTHFEPDELALMQTVCDQVAAALERSQLLTQLQQRAAELTHANRIKDEFMAVLSHELRSPLNPILGWATLLRRKLKDPLLGQAAETIERNVRLQVQLIDDLLDISRILRGKLTLNREAVRLEKIIAAALETVQLAATTKAISIQTHVAPEVGWVLGDSARLQQVVWNLLSNAVKFTPKGGQVEVGLSLGAGQASSNPKAPYDQLVQLTVSDTGKGISPSFLPHVFESFRQEDGTTTRQFGGLGLGLAIVRHIIEMHGGTVSATSPGEDQGATFTVSLPIFQPQSDLQPQQMPSPLTFNDEPLQGCRILLVEDDPDSRIFLSILLEQAGATVSAIASASVALARFPDSQPHILISDIGMPELDGYQLIRQIRSLPADRGGAAPAIALTAYASESDAERAIAAGFQRHIAKPVDPSDLIEAILDLMPRGRDDQV